VTLNLTCRNALLTAAYAGAAFGLPRPVSFIEVALAQKGPEAGKGFRPFEFGQVQGFILNDGVWEKPHDPAFIENVSVEETKAALAVAGIANDVVPIPFNITLIKFGNETVLFDAGTGQFQPTAVAMIANMAAAGIKPAQITRVVVSHFHPDHVFGLMSKAPDNTPVFPNATIYVPGTEFKFWMSQRRPRHPGARSFRNGGRHRAVSAFGLPIYPAPAGTAPGIGDGNSLKYLN
jgi:hypothetical protein